MKKFLIYLSLFIGLVVICFFAFGDKGLLAGLLPGLLVFKKQEAILEHKAEVLKEEIKEIDKELEKPSEKMTDKEIENYFNNKDK